MKFRPAILTAGIGLLAMSAPLAWSAAGGKADGYIDVAATPSETVVARGLPVTFARSGQVASAGIAMGGNVSVASVVMVAFGRVWTGPAEVRHGAAQVAVPEVRVPTVFDVVEEGDGGGPLGQLVAYPAAPPMRHGNDVQCYSLGAPTWFEQWAEAIGLHVIPTTSKAIHARPWAVRRSSSPPVLVVGCGGAGNTAEEMLATAKAGGIPVVVLEAKWMAGGKACKGGITVRPTQMDAGLAKIAEQKWSTPLRFSQRARPWPAVCNRWSWIADKSGPLLEEIGFPEGPDRVILSYVPWQEQLGRQFDNADTTLAAVLASATKRPTRHWRRLEIIWPERTDITVKDRPVISGAIGACNDRAQSDFRPVLCLLDLRGTAQPPAQLSERLNKLEQQIAPRGPHFSASLVILGDDRLLADWKWAKLDRTKMRSQRDFVTWLPADGIPQTVEQRIQLMQVLTREGVAFSPIREKDNDRQNN